MADWRERAPQAIALGRIGFGVALVVAPGLAGRLFLGRECSRPSVRFLCRIFGGRDLAIGLVQLRALRSGDARALASALWLGAGCDAFDAAAAWRGRELPRWGRVLVALTGSATAGVGAAAALGPPPGPDAAAA